jgi:AraC-like DNA-binding protein
MSTESSFVEYRIRIQKAIDHINRHLAEDLPLDVLADAACFSSFHFHRIFSLMVGDATDFRELYIKGVQNILQSHFEGSRTMNVTIKQVPTYFVMDICLPVRPS